MSELDPIVGNWYQDLETQTRFKVVAVDDDAGAVEVQHFEGEVEELDLDAWYELVLEPIAPPEDWSGAFDDLDRDDLGDGDVPTAPSRENPLDEFE